MSEVLRKYDSDNAHVLAAYQSETEGKYLEAIENYKKAIAENPDLGIVYKHIGNIYYRLGMLSEAINYLNQAVEKLPDFPTPLFELGLAYYREGYFKMAAAQMNKVIELDQNFLLAHYWLGIISYHRGNLTKAKEHYLHVINLSHDFTIAHFHLGVTNLRLGFYEDSVKNFDALLLKNPESPAVYALKGEALLNLNKEYEARIAFKKALEFDPDDVKAQNGLAMLGDYKDMKF